MGLASLDGGGCGVVLPIRGNRLNSHERKEEEEKSEHEHADSNRGHHFGAGSDSHGTRMGLLGL